MINPFEELNQKLDLILKYLQNQNSKNVVNEKEWGDINMASEITGYAISTIYIKASQKKIPHVKRDGKLWFKKSDLLSWIEKGK